MLLHAQFVALATVATFILSVRSVNVTYGKYNPCAPLTALNKASCADDSEFGAANEALNKIERNTSSPWLRREIP